MTPEKLKAYTRPILAIISTIGIFAILFALLFVSVPEANKGVFNMSLGAVITGTMAMAYAFYFGSAETKAPDEPKEPKPDN